MWEDLISGRLSELEDSKQYQIKIANRSAALEIFCQNEDINRAWENKENIKPLAKDNIGLYELKHHKPCFDENVYDFRSKEAIGAETCKRVNNS
jgi:hypothetical protein